MLFGIAFVCAAVGVVPLLMRKKFGSAAVAGTIALLADGFILYASTPSTVWPLFGVPGLLVAILWTISALIDAIQEDEAQWTFAFPIVYAVLLIGTGILGGGWLRSSSYRDMIGTMEERVWTQDTQQKDPRHMRMATAENALYQAKKVLGSDGAVGSQFTLSESNMTLQMINGELWYVTPLDYNGYSVWSSSNGVPGYVMVHGEDERRQPILKVLPDNQRMRYMPEAYFEDNLERHIRNEGFTNYALTDYTFEIDESGHPFWVVTAYKPTIMWSGEKTEGVIIVNPISGETKFYAIDQVPDWVDRVIPDDFVKTYLTWNGEYANGWMNSWWGKLGLTKPENPILVYGIDGQPEYVTGITSKSDKDDSLVALVYTNSRTGKSIRYKVAGGATDSAVLEAVGNNSQVKFKHLHGATPQIYNIYGSMASVVPLLNDSHAFQGVAIVPINNIQLVAVGNDPYEALREYEKLMANGGQQVALDKERDLKTVTGVVDRFNQEILTSGQTYYIHVAGVPHIFTGGSSDLSSAKLPLTKIGDRVVIEYYASDRDVVPMHGFDNASLILSETKAQKETRAAALARREKEETRQDTATTMENLKNLSPEELKAVAATLKKKNK